MGVSDGSFCVLLQVTESTPDAVQVQQILSTMFDKVHFYFMKETPPNPSCASVAHGPRSASVTPCPLLTSEAEAEQDRRGCEVALIWFVVGETVLSCAFPGGCGVRHGSVQRRPRRGPHGHGGL